MSNGSSSGSQLPEDAAHDLPILSPVLAPMTVFG